MYGLCFEGQWRWTYHLLLIIWLLLLAATPPKALGYFLGDTKAVLHGCEDHWTLQDRTSMPLLFQMTVCVDIRVTVPGSWVAFSYSSVHAPRPELGLEGDDKAVYGWLLRVRHRFPVELSPTVWHRVCLRRDVPNNSFSLEVDGKMVAARTVIAQAISPSGSLWLGCRPRDRPSGDSLGEVELYMFRMWNDLDHHGVCEDGTVIGWSAQYWGLTSPRARQRDPDLLCAPATPGPTSSPVIVVTHVSNQTSQVTDAYFWMSIRVKVKEGDKNEQDVQTLVSDAFGCSGNSDTASDNRDFCLAVEVNCVAKSQISTTTCDVLLQRSVAVSACEVQREGVSALQTVGDEQIEVKITREVERVGRYHCEDAAPSSGGFVRCASTSSLEDICQANKASTVTCSLIEPDSNPDLQPVSNSCSRQFFATRINITSDAVNVDRLKSLLSRPRLTQSCGTTLFSCMVILEMSGPVDICSLNESLQELIDSNANITNVRPLTRMLICGPPDLSVDALLKSNLTWVDSDLLNSNVCQPDLLECEENEVRAVLLNESCPHTTRQTTTQPSTLTKTSITATPVTTATEHTNTEAGKTNASRSTVQPNMTTPLAEINSTQSSTWEPVFQTSSQNTSSSVNSTLQITTTALIDSTLNTTTLSPSHITVYNETTASTLNETSTTTSNSTIGTFTPSPTLVNNVTTTTKNNTTASNRLTKAYNVTTAHNNQNLHNGTTTLSNTTVDTFTASPNHTADYNVTTVNIKQHKSTVTTSTTISTFTSSPNYTITTTTRNYTTASKHDTTELTTVDQTNGTTSTSNAKMITSTTSPNHTVVYSGTTASNSYTTDYNNGSITTFSTFTPSPSYNVTTSTKKHTTDSNNYTTVYNVTTASNNYTTQYNVSTADRNPQKGTNTTSNTTVYTAGYNVTTTTSYVKQHNSTVTTTDATISTFTSSPNYTTVNNVTTATKNYTTTDNITTVDNNGNQQNGTTTTSNTTISTFTTPNPTVVYNVTTSANNTTVYSVTTPSNNYTTDYNAMTADNNNYTTTTSNATISTYTSSPNYTMVNNVTTATKNYTTHFNNYTTQYNIRNMHNSTTTSNTTISTFTTPNPTVVYNVTTSASNTTVFNAMTADNNNRTSTTSNATKSTSTASPNYTMVNNVTTATKNYTTHFNNYTTQYNRFIANIRNLQNGTTTTRSTTVSTFTPSSNHTEVYNKTTNSIYVRQHNSTVTTADATISTSTSSPNYTVVNNVTTAIKNHTTAFKNYTTVHNNGKQQNTTNTTNTTISTYTTSVYSATTAASNYTTQHNVTASNSNTTEYNVTTAGNIRNLQNGTSTTSNTTFSTSNHTAEYNLTTTRRHVKQHNSTVTTTSTTMSTFTTSLNYTMASKITTATKNYTTALNNYTTDNNNGIITTSNTNTSTFTPSLSYTTVNNVTTVSHKYTTAENVTTKTLFQNKRTTYNVTTATPHRNMTTSTAATSKNSTVDNMTAVVDNTTKSAVAPLNNQTANHTTARMTYTTTTGKNYTSSTTAANGSIHHNETVGTGLNLRTTASSLTTDLNLTTRRPVFSLTTMVASTTHTGATSITTAKTTESQEAREEAVNELLVQTQNVSQLNSSQVAQLTGQLEKLLDGPTVSQAVGQKAVNIISNLMEGDAQALTASANRLIRLVDDLGLKLVVTGDKEIVSSTSLVLAVKTVDGINFPTTSVDILNTDNVQFSDTSRSPPLGSVYLPSSLTTGLRPEEQQQASRVQFTYFTKSTLFQDATLDNQTSVSPILGSSVANLSISNLSENISFTIRMINFPQDLSRDGLQDRQQVQILTFITYIGCGLSAVFLAVTLLTYLSFEKLLRDIPAKILVQLCISLLLLNLLFLLDGWLAIYPATGLCISTAFFLHYFLLTSFTWAGLEALHMYLSVIRVFTPYLSRYMLKFSLMGWGIPLIVVIVVISVDKDNYGLVTYGKYTDGSTDDFCWLRNNIAFYVAVVGYFVLIFALCLLVFIMVMVQLARIKRQNPQNQSPNRGVMTDMRSIAGLVILLGLTWGFALFAWGPLYLPFVYLFTIFNTLQGFLVFVFHCAVKENVRRQWRTYLCCGRLRLAENSEWSRTATQNTKNIPGATATASAPRLPSRSSSVISDGTNSNSSMYLDSGISDCTGSDVVLNEIHRQSMSPVLLRMQEHVHERDDDKTSIYYLSSLSFFESESLIKPVREKKVPPVMITVDSSKCCVTFSGATPVQSQPVEVQETYRTQTLHLKTKYKSLGLMDVSEVKGIIQVIWHQLLIRCQITYSLKKQTPNQRNSRARASPREAVKNFIAKIKLLYVFFNERDSKTSGYSSQDATNNPSSSSEVGSLSLFVREHNTRNQRVTFKSSETHSVGDMVNGYVAREAETLAPSAGNKTNHSELNRDFQRCLCYLL
ncbi:Adhesion G-protein coupled receptor G2 [Collichthys lucidus]|uniref:Adhesion G-protein coupled receptor G2 n=1 Tax=Collichthys lucidus TaxID=240159 RepID=A0A4U5VGU3_COLLU|nr:Adhesion G-protein coupled receptor G2 [Collichthys lucidus]